MNVFEDFLTELKDEHLIEESSFEVSTTSDEPRQIEIEMHDPPNVEAATVLESSEFNEITDERSNDEILENERFLSELSAEAEGASEFGVASNETVSGEVEFFEIEGLDDDQSISYDQTHNEPINLQPKQKLSGFELFRKRAVEEVTALQMADNIFTSIEREQMKMVGKPYDDIKVKQVLHSFIRMTGEISAAQHAQAEFELRQQTETWYSALADRDTKISVQNLRYCCENTRPPLSPPALLSLARFYRNAQFSETVRNKFDLIVTRLFSSDIEESKRELAFTREELVEHLTELYAEWESIPFYSTDKNDESIVVTILRFEDMIAEARNAKSFQGLIKSDIFNRVRALKRSTEEIFYAPQIAAISIICNIEIGNIYLDLLALEQENSSNESIEEKYGFGHDESISDATSKSLQLANLLSRPRTKVKLIDLGVIDPNQKSKKKKRGKGKFASFFMLAGVNKWLLAGTVLTVLFSAGLILWVEVFSSPPKTSDEVKTINLEKTPFKTYIESARMNNETLFVIANSAFDELAREKKEELLAKLLADGSQKGYKKIHLLDKNSMTIGSATQNRIDIK